MSVLAYVTAMGTLEPNYRKIRATEIYQPFLSLRISYQKFQKHVVNIFGPTLSIIFAIDFKSLTLSLVDHRYLQYQV